VINRAPTDPLPGPVERVRLRIFRINKGQPALPSEREFDDHLACTDVLPDMVDV
jgi:hypothetical protein